MTIPAGTPKTIWSDNSATTVVSVAANLTAGQVAGNNATLDNSTERLLYGLAVLYVAGFSVAPTANYVIELWMVRQNVDGTADATAGSGVTATPATPAAGFISTDGAELAGVFPLAATTSPQRVACDINLLGVDSATFYIRNLSGQTLTAGVGTECTVTIAPYSPGPT